jgi:hypothetical protein
VPLIAHVVLLKLKPAGNAGLDEHEVIGPPELVGVMVVIAVPTVSVAELGE